MALIKQMPLFKEYVKPADVVYTPVNVAQYIINELKPKGVCLDPCRGDGAFYNYLPIHKEYCEIEEGKDFFDYTDKVDWIIGNPPYSIFKEFLEHSFSIAENVSFLVPTNKVFQRQVIMDMISRWGGVYNMIIFGSGSLINFPFGFSVGNFHFKKNYKGNTKITMGMNQLKMNPIS